MIATILSRCARDQPDDRLHADLHRLIDRYRRSRPDWLLLLHGAEQQGVAPLLHKHLQAGGCRLPAEPERLLKTLYLRSRHAARTRSATLAEIIGLLRDRGIDALAVKGIGLSRQVYSDPALRPMRDIDLLLAHNDLPRAETLLLQAGFTRQNRTEPPGCHHLAPLTIVRDALPIEVELHHHLLPLDGRHPPWPLAESRPGAVPLTVHSTTVSTLSPEDALCLAYLHGFRAPLSYARYRLIHVADIISLVERFVDTLDWTRVERRFPRYRAALSRFHFLSPWTDTVIDTLALPVTQRPAGCGVGFSGWPQIPAGNWRRVGLRRFLLATLVPSQWWLQLHYGHLDGLAYQKARWFDHPREIWRWLKTSRRRR